MLTLLLGIGLLAACQPQTVEVTRVVTETQIETVTEQVEVTRVVEGEVVTEQVEVTRVVEVMAEEEEMEELPYGLTPGKPYDGTELNFLICCATAPQFAALNKRSAEFTELTGITINWADSPFSEFQSKIIAEVTAGSPAFDLIAYVDAWGPSIENYLQPLDGYIEQDGWDLDNYPDAYLQAGLGYLSGVRYGIPLRGHPFMMFYREDIFADLGLEPPTTWAEFEAASEAILAADLTDAEGSKIYPTSMYYGVGGGQNIFVWESMLWSNGGDIFDENFEPIFNSAEGVEATQRYIDLLNKGYSSPGSVAFNEQEANAEYNAGRAAMFTGWWWMYSRGTNCEANPAKVCENAGFAKVPGWEGKGTSSYGHIWQTGINKFSRNQDAAWEYMKFFLNEEIEKEIVLAADDPAYDTNVAVRLSVLADEEVNAAHGGLQAVGAEVLETARSQALLPEWPEILSLLEVAINDMAANGADVQETLDEVAEDIRAVMERAGYYD
ncbi:MAG: sugar ABC transporter substrate-binding protein [Chloroflexi bacterium]|nr:MAG: sugar ABC transporter substrate-binding protein [Chloroflexota bacterium]